MKKVLGISVAIVVVAIVAFVWQIKILTPKLNELKAKTPPTQEIVSSLEQPKTINISVPFTSQSPFAQWQDPRQQDACEEASVLMAVYWAQGKPLTKELALQEILAISKFEEETYGSYIDTNAKDSVERIFRGYFHFSNVEAKDVATSSAIISELGKGNIVIVPANGRALKNPHFKQPGPERHNVLIRGHDPTTKEFITNDAGIKDGEGYRYPEEVLFAAIRDYPTGDHVPITEVKRVMIVVAKD